jgi:hypothetical protein
MRRLVQFLGIADKNRGLYLHEFLADISFRRVREVQFPPVFLFDLKLLILPILQEHLYASRAGYIMQVIALIKAGTPPLFEGFRERADFSAAD